jgi:acetyl esterase/lipase
MRSMEIRVDRKAALKKIKTLVLSPKNDIETFRTKLEKKFKSDFLPNRVELIEKKIGSVKCDILVPEVFASNRVTVYIHGGSFVGGSRDSWRSFCSVLATATSSKVIVPEFRLAPSYPYPASLEDLEVIFDFLHNEDEISENKNEIIFAADGSGASIATGLLFRVGERKKIVSKLILFSPWLDLSFDTSAFPSKKAKDEILSSEDLKCAAELYTYSSNLSNLFVSPLQATQKEFENFPEVYIQCGKKEILFQQAQRFCDLLNSCRIKFTLDAVDDMMYMFQMADEFLTESHFAVERVGNFVNQRNGLTEKEKKEREHLLRENNIIVD